MFSVVCAWLNLGPISTYPSFCASASIYLSVSLSISFFLLSEALRYELSRLLTVLSCRLKRYSSEQRDYIASVHSSRSERLRLLT